MVYVRAISRAPHPTGSEEHTRVRDYVREELGKLGLSPELETGMGAYSRRGRQFSGYVENIVARMPGTANTRPVMLAAHYDSTPRGPGAADDAHGVAALLGTMRALNSGPRLRNDVIVLITDGEERGLLGADVFMRQHPWRKEPGVVLNFEARGTGGPSQMFETSAGNEWMVRELEAAVPQAQASSFAYEIYRRMPNDTDLTLFKRGGLAGMNFAFIEHPEFYHTIQDDPAHLDQRSLQEDGRYALALARRFGAMDLNGRQSGDAVYFPTPVTSLIVYPGGWALPIALLTLVGLLAAALAGWWRSARGTWIGVPLAVVAVLHLAVARIAPGASYLFAWPIASGVAAFGMLVTAPRFLWLGWRTALLMIGPGPVLALLVPLIPMMVIALGARGAAPLLAADGLMILVCLSPQIALIVRSGGQSRPNGR
jgi:hypothetical protein